MTNSLKTEKSALDIAKKKTVREQREISVHKEEREDLSDDVYYVTPTKKVSNRLELNCEHVRTFEPETQEGNRYEKLRLEDSDVLSEGDRVVVEGDEDPHTITEITTRQIVTNFGDKFRKSDAGEWGGGSKSITHKLVKNE